MAEPVLDAQLSQFRRDLDQLLREMAELAEAPLPLEKAFDEILLRLEGAVGASASGIWIKSRTRAADENSELGFELVFDRAIASAKLGVGEAQNVHRRSLDRIVATQEPAHFPPANETDNIRLLAPIRCGARPAGVLEIEIDPVKGRQGISGRLQFVERVAELVGRTVRNHRFRDLDQRAGLWDDLDSFLKVAFSGRTVVQTAYLIANEGRRLLGCDRLSVLRRRASGAKVVAISGQETVAHRSNTVRLLARLTAEVLKFGEPIVYDGRSSDDWPQPVRTALDRYLRENPSRLLVVKPLFDPARSQKQPNLPAEAALVAEVMQGDDPDESFGLRLELVARHGGRALFRSIDESRVLFRPVLHPVGRLLAGAVTTRTRKTLVWCGVATLVTAVMMFVPTPFRVEGKGRLFPRSRQNVFAPQAGFVAHVHVQNGSTVAAGADLVTLENPVLAQELSRAQGELTNKRNTLKLMELAEERATTTRTVADDNQLAARKIELKGEVDRLERGVELLQEEFAQLRVRAPYAGTVLDWNPEELLRKHLQPGEELLELGDVSGDWIVEVDFPEKNATAIGRLTADAVDLPASFILSSAPKFVYAARLEELGAAVRVVERDNVLRGRCRLLDRPPEALLRSGLEVRVRVDCGTRPLGYVLFRDVVDFIRGLLFW